MSAPQESSQFRRAQPLIADDDAIDIMDYFGAILEYRFLIGAAAFLGLVLGVFYTLVATPLYTADTLIQVEPDQSAGLPALEDISTLFEGEASIDAEIQLITSRMVVGETIQKLGLDVQIEPIYAPVIGKAIARRYEAGENDVAAPWLGLDQYAWGGEEIAIDILELPPEFVNEPLQILVEQNGQFSLYSDDVKLLQGAVGQLAQSKPANKENFNLEDLVQLHISRLKARPGTRFEIVKRPLHDVIEMFLGGLNVQEKGKSSGMLTASMIHSNQDEVAQYINTIADVYVDQNLQRSSAEAELSLEFLEQQLPPLKEQLDAAENAYNMFRVQNGSIDLQTETQSVLQELSSVGASMLSLEQQRRELRKRFKPAHPAIKALDGKIAVLRGEEQRLEANTDKLPSVQKEILRLAREVEMNTILYSKLLNTAQELKVAKAGTVGNVRVIDYGFRPNQAVKPNKKLVIAAGLVAGAAIGMMLALLFRALRGGVRDPDDIEKKLGLPVYASVMHSEEQAAIVKYHAKDKTIPLGILASRSPNSVTVESLRSLRTSLFFSLQQADNNVIMITGPSPKIGKTFSSVNLAAVLAESGKKVLVIDGDLRRGTLHQYLGVSRKRGLSELVMNSKLDPYAQLHMTEQEGLYALTTGQLPASPAELLLHNGFTDLLEEYKKHFDFVVLDAPPILAVTDAAILGRSAGTTLLVARANSHKMRELDQAVKQFAQAGIEIRGVIFNDVTQSFGRYGYGKYVYRYDYQTN